ncbi:hypothetical protein GYH30_016287 [Glycine max]|nr:hypothetical protein GYH30_016287 [Glycine max]
MYIPVAGGAGLHQRFHENAIAVGLDCLRSGSQTLALAFTIAVALGFERLHSGWNSNSSSAIRLVGFERGALGLDHCHSGCRTTSDSVPVGCRHSGHRFSPSMQRVVVCSLVGTAETRIGAGLDAEPLLLILHGIGA